MTAAALMRAFTAEGGSVRVDSGNLVLTGPAEVRQRHRVELVRLKPDILALLATHAPPPASLSPPTRPRLTWQQELATPEVSAILATFWDRPKLTLYQPNFEGGLK